MNTKIEIPKTDIKFLGIVEKELVVLRPEYDDANYSRIYKVDKVDGEFITVEVVSEIAINKNTQSQEQTPDEQSSLMGKFWKCESKYFQPYM